MVFRADHLDATGRTGGFAEIAPNASFAAVVIAQEGQRTPVGIGDGTLLPRVLERDGLMEHVLERHFHGVPDLVEEGSVKEFSCERSDSHTRLCYTFSIVTPVRLKDGTPVIASTWTDIRSFTGGSLKCSGKKHV